MVSDLGPKNGIEDAEQILLGIVKSPTNSQESVSDTETDLLLEIARRNGPAKKASRRSFRFYNLIARSRDNIIMEFDLISQSAGRKRAKLRRNGYKVDLIETNSGDGIVHREPDTLDGKGVPNPIPYPSSRNSLRNRNRAAKLRAMIVTAENNKLRRIAERKQNDKCFVYEKSGNQLRFSGSPDEMLIYLQDLEAKGELDMEKLCLYIPDHVIGKH